MRFGIALRSSERTCAGLLAAASRTKTQFPTAAHCSQHGQPNQTYTQYKAVFPEFNARRYTTKSKSAPAAVPEIDDNDNRTSDADASHPPNEIMLLENQGLKKTLGSYRDLVKLKLSGFVVLTSMAGYAMAPTLLSRADLMPINPINLTDMLFLTVGTSLCVGSANAINQWLETPFDSQMSRTRTRPLVQNRISPFHAFGFGVASGAVGFGTLYAAINPLTAYLGLANIFIYTALYTPSKRMSILNTWYGAVVGAIPPIMGWAAATNQIGVESLILGGILYAWQFPHFNSLSWNLRQDYSKAGYVMASVTHPNLCKRIALRYSLLLLPLCYACTYTGMTTNTFLLTSTAVNALMSFYAYKFYQHANAKSARKLFFSSIVHLPLLLVALLLAKEASCRLSSDCTPTSEQDDERAAAAAAAIE